MKRSIVWGAAVVVVGGAAGAVLFDTLGRRGGDDAAIGVSVPAPAQPETPAVGAEAGKTAEPEDRRGAGRAPKIRVVEARPDAAADPDAPRFDAVRVEPSGNVVIAGRARPDAEVVVTDGDKELGRTQADARGAWVLLPNAPLSGGTHELSLAAESRDGGTAPLQSPRTVIVMVPETEKDAADGGALAVAVPRDGGAGVRVLQKPPARGGGAAGPLSLDTIDYDREGQVEVTGRADKGARVQLYIDNEPVGAVRVDERGEWRVAPDRKVAPGEHRVRVDQIDPAGAVAARIELNFSRARPLEDLPAGTVVFVRPGNSLWRIARRSYGRGVRFTEIYEANRSQIRDPDLIYPGQIFFIPASGRTG